MGYAFPVSSKIDIKERLDALWSQYPDATHVCYAWVLGVGGDEYRANDDGEPGNSAGQPILREIRSNNLTHVLVAVVRYYGGKKLGVSGLIESYGMAAKLALEQAEVRTETLKKKCWIRDLGANDYKVYEYAGRLGFEIISPPKNPGGYFEIVMELSQFEPLVKSLESLPNFDLRDEQ